MRVKEREKHYRFLKYQMLWKNLKVKLFPARMQMNAYISLTLSLEILLVVCTFYTLICLF